MTTLITLIFVILVLSGFFSGTESALLSLRPSDLETLMRNKKVGSAVLKKVHDSLDRSLMTILIFNNIVNIVGSIFVGKLVITLYGDAVLAVITTALTFGIIVFSEILPKSLAIHYATPVSLLVAPIIYLLTLLLSPLLILLEILITLFKKGERKVGTEEQIRSLVTLGRRAGHIEKDEGQLIYRAFVLNDKRASAIMTPLKDVVHFRSDSTIDDATQKIIGLPYSRFPVFGPSIHNIIGFVIARDLLEAAALNQTTKPISSITHQALVVDGNMRSDKLLELFRDQHKHFAVVKEKGKTVGIVTLEDIIEELVGEIEDERIIP